jgi:hypothetical protein
MRHTHHGHACCDDGTSHVGLARRLSLTEIHRSELRVALSNKRSNEPCSAWHHALANRAVVKERTCVRVRV